MNTQLKQNLRRLRLSGLMDTLELRLNEAVGNQLTHVEFLELLLSDELAVREDRAITRRTKAARFRELRTIEDFDFSFNPSIKRKDITALATCRFIRENQDILFTGPPGVGKSHLAQALGYQAVKMGYHVLYRSIFDAVGDLHQAEVLGEQKRELKKYLKPDLLIIDDMGLKQLPKNTGEHLFEIIMRRFELRSTVMTSNRSIEEWGKLIGDVPTATAILDRFLSRAEIIQITGKSYRMKNRTCSKKNKDAKQNNN
jgi:DNA replication protein DnaC